jgi:UDP-N-acetylmuramyl-tripeptide synthetase
MEGMRLNTLLEALPVKSFAGPEDGEIRSIHYDSRTVKPGGLFVAIKGVRTDGARFIDDAIQRGAAAVVAEPPPPLRQKDVTIVEVENARQALAHIASKFWGDPSSQLYVIGVTGTNGKTTTAYLIEAILKRAGVSVGVMGTIDCRFQGKHFASPVTTPESADLMEMLRKMLDSGVTHVVLEVSSHAIDMDRVRSCRFDVGIFTNLSQDHLDYHRDMEAYWKCKKRFFLDHLSANPKNGKATAVINCDDIRGKALAREVPVKALRTGFAPECDVRAEAVTVNLDGTSGKIHTPAGGFDFSSSLVGQHNVRNILSATATGIAIGLPLSDIREGIHTLSSVPGRLESVPNPNDLSILVDYAHTPEALENVLSALRKLTRNRLITVFGCGGDRDKDKRPIMGEIAARLSDICVLTTDNPRSESPAHILAQIEAGTALAQGVSKYDRRELLQGRNGWGYTIEPDRRRAIELGIRLAKPGDCVLIAGKGHETYQIVGDRTLPFDDRIEASNALERFSNDSTVTGVDS